MMNAQLNEWLQSGHIHQPPGEGGDHDQPPEASQAPAQPPTVLTSTTVDQFCLFLCFIHVDSQTYYLV